METRPTTLDGVKALLRYVTDFVGDDTDVSKGVLANVAKALESRTLETGGPVQESKSPESKFGRAYQELFEARAGVEKLNAGGYDPDDDPDGICDALVARVATAELQLACLPAMLSHQLVNKFETLETMISERERNGRPLDNRHMLMLASVKADLYQFRFKRDETE